MRGGITEMSEVDTEIRQYYLRINLDRSQRCYCVNRVGGAYLGTTRTLEEALYYRDLYSDIREGTVPRPSELDLKTENPYLNEGLKYPVPERLQRSPDYKPYSPRGSIYQRSRSCYALYYSNTYLGCCRTYEQAYYALGKLKENNWDTSKLPEILEAYPEWYTWLMGFYRYIVVDKTYEKSTGEKRYMISIPQKHIKSDSTLDILRGYTNLEDALYERDFLVAHDWDYELLVEAIDDKQNPYYNMELPPYPERKLRNIRQRKTHEKEIRLMQKEILTNPEISQRELSRTLNIHDINIRNWLKLYGTDWMNFKTIVLNGEDPLEKLTLKPLVYQPDLSPSKPSNFKGYVHHNHKSKANPWNIEYQHKSYGVYPNRELALKIAKDLEKVGWDKSQLQCIQRKHGHIAPHGSRDLIYKKGNIYSVRKTIGRKLGYFGTYPNHRLAEIVRDIFRNTSWDKDRLPEVKEQANQIYKIENTYYNNMFGGVRL